MRLFIAAELPDAVREALAETSADLRAGMRGRYVPPARFHVTLAFLGEVEAARVADAEAALEAGCAGQAAFDVRLGELGSFGRRASATLWQGFDKESAGQLAALATNVRAACSREGLDFDGKTYLPHVTLMRAADVRGGVLPMPHMAGGRLGTVALVHSDLSGDHPRYHALHRVALG